MKFEHTRFPVYKLLVSLIPMLIILIFSAIKTQHYTNSVMEERQQDTRANIKACLLLVDDEYMNCIKDLQRKAIGLAESSKSFL